MMTSRNSPELRSLARADFEPLALVAQRIWREHYSTIISQAQIDYMLAGRFTPENLGRYIDATDRWMYVLRQNGGLVGYCSYALTAAAGEMKLEQLYLLPELHGHGLGRYMLEFVEASCIARDCRTLILQVNKQNTKAIAVYRRGGFTVRKEVVVDIGQGFVMDDFIMEKHLQALAR